MAYIDNQTITVDAILTQKGRQLLAKNGNLNITYFALADDEIDYTLYQPNHPNGSAFYDIALRNTPIFEPLTDETQTMKYKLVTLNQGVTSIPVITIAQDKILVTKDYAGDIIINPSTNPAYNLQAGYTAILGNKNVGLLIVQKTNAINTVSNVIPTFAGDINISSAQVVVGNSFRFVPNSGLNKTTTTNLTIYGNESGGSTAIEVTVTVPTQK
ncbi:MAG TPA: hypothetical protein PLC59_01025 [Bacteroidales bacterium]|nr:hypothetical protein [Bacteroidales bacterium]